VRANKLLGLVNFEPSSTIWWRIPRSVEGSVDVFHVFVASFHGHARTQCWHGVKESQKGKKFVADEEKTAMSVNVSCVTRSCHRKQAKESNILGEDCYTLQQQLTFVLCKTSS
jgi:hypothetical protein